MCSYSVGADTPGMRIRCIASEACLRGALAAARIGGATDNNCFIIGGDNITIRYRSVNARGYRTPAIIGLGASLFFACQLKTGGGENSGEGGGIRGCSNISPG